MKKKPIEKFLKVLILFTSIVSMISCEKNEIEDSVNTKISSENISKNQLLDELNNNEIIEFVTNSLYNTNSNELLKNNQITFSNSDSPIFQKIVKPNEYTTYSLRLNSYTSYNPFFKYFVINKEISGIEKAGFVKYIPSSPTYELDVDNFTGDIEIYNTDNELFAKTSFQNGQIVNNNSNKSNNTTFGCYNVSYIVAHPCSHGGGHMPGESCGAGYTNDAYYEIRTTVVCVDTIKSIVPPDTFGGGDGGGGGATVLNSLNIPEPYEGEPGLSNQSFMFYQQVYNFLQANPTYNNLVNHQFANSCLVSDWIVPAVVDYFRYNSFDEDQNQINVINAMNMFTNFLQFESNQYNFEEMLVNKFQTFQLLLQNSQWFSNQTNQTIQDIFNYLLQNHLNEQSRVFVQEFMISSIESGLNLDFEKSLKSPANIDFSAIDISTPEGQQFSWIYNELTDTNDFKSLFINTFGGTQGRLNVKFELVDDLPDGIYGTCRLRTHNGNYSNIIRINKSKIGTTSNLSVAKTIFHEAIHAYLNIKNIDQNLGSTIPALDGMDLKEVIGTFYQGFGGILVNGHNQTQHAFIFDHLVPVMQNALSDLKYELISPYHINQMETNTSAMFNGEAFNWNDLFYFLSLNGLQESTPFIALYPTGSVGYSKWVHYGYDMALINLTKIQF